MLAENSEEVLRQELEVNLFGTLNMIRAFAPVLKNNGGGAIANMLSVVSWFVFPLNATYCASKHAALALTDGVRMELKAQGTSVTGVYAGFIDTDMVAAIDAPKTSPKQVAERTLEGIRKRVNHVIADDSAQQISEALKADQAAYEAEMQSVWDNSRN
jgi:NAD(P)-dependent dehydrogenase (short-subunit alcohol dehydrogenase family)